MDGEDRLGSENPYAAPQHDFGERPDAPSLPSKTSLEATKKLLLQIRPWTTFLAIFGLVVGGLFVVVGVSASISIGRMAGAASALGAFLFYVVTGLILLASAVQLIRYGRRIRAFANEAGGVEELNAAMDAQRAFWRLLGITVAIMLLLYAALIVLSILSFGLAM